MSSSRDRRGQRGLCLLDQAGPTNGEVISTSARGAKGSRACKFAFICIENANGVPDDAKSWGDE